MHCLVPVKRVVDYRVKVRVAQDGSCVQTNGLQHSMNPFDEIAMEAACQAKEAGHIQTITAISIGTSEVQTILREALARGADTAVWIETTDEVAQAIQSPIEVARVLQVYLKKQPADLVLMGKQSIDGDNNQTGQMLAGLLNWPQATFASHIAWPDKTQLQVTREVDAGLEMVKLTLPAVITTDLRLNTPRYIALPNLMKAKSKPIEKMTLDELGMSASLKPHIKILNVKQPTSARENKKVQTVDELIAILKNEAGVL